MLDPKMRRLATALSFFLLAPIPALAQTTTAPDIVVTGVRPEQAQSFVTRLAIPAPTADQLPRWDNTVCTSIAGMPARQGQFLADRIAQRAAAVGLQPGGPGCQANIAVFVTGESDTFARQLFGRIAIGSPISRRTTSRRLAKAPWMISSTRRALCVGGTLQRPPARTASPLRAILPAAA